MKIYFIFLPALLLVSIVSAQTTSSNWKGKLEVLLDDFKSCMDEKGNPDCKTLVGESIKSVYNINDFYDNNTNRHASAVEIANSIDAKANWKKLGQAYKQEVINRGQELANENVPVLAVYKGKASAHVVLVLPGELQPSGSWNLQVPRVASFFIRQPEKSFIDKSMAYAFSKTMLLHIELYARN